MKTKIIALILAVFCLSMCFVGCDKACETHVDENEDGICDVCELEIPIPECDNHKDEDNDQKCDVCKVNYITPCATHKDEDADKICDVCKRAVVVVELKADKEEAERVDMVVNAIPEDVEIGKYIELKDTADSAITTATKIEGNVAAYTNDKAFVLITQYNDADEVTTYTVYDFVNGKNVIPVFTNRYTGTALDGYVEVYVTLEEAYFSVEKEIVENYATTSHQIEYYSYAGTLIHSIRWTSAMAEEMDWYSYLYENDIRYEEQGDYLYVWADDQVKAIDLETRAVVYETDADEFVYRPIFSAKNDTYGYVENENTVFVYKLDKWVNCVASYQIPSYFLDKNWAVLENGNVLIYASVQLPYDAVSYDYVDEGNKYDLVYVILDVVQNKTTEVEFGYQIVAAYDEETIATYYTSQALNVFYVYPIVNDRIDMMNGMELVVDNTLTVLYNCFDVLPELNGENYRLTDNLFLKTTWYDDINYICEVVDEKGEKVAYVPVGAFINENYISYDNKIYNFKMEELIDLDDYNGSDVYDSFAILSTYDEETFETTYYYYAIGTTEDDLVKLDGIANINSCEAGFMLTYAEEVEGLMTTTHLFYNAENKLVNSIKYAGETVYGMTAMPIAEESNVWEISILGSADGVYYIAK